MEHTMAKAVLTISSRNYGAWALRGWLMAKFAGLDFSEKVIPPASTGPRPQRMPQAASPRTA